MYCDYLDESFKHRGGAAYPGEGVGSFAAETGPAAKKLAKRAGWKIERGGARAICPSCIKAGRTLND